MFLRRAQFALASFAVVGAVSFGAGLAYAQVPDVNVPDVNIDVPTPNVNVDVNPDTPSGSEINCQIYADLIARGEPIPPGFDASGCEGGGGGGGGSTPACSDGVDNDGDGLTDSADPGCSSSTDTDESNSTGGGGNGGGDNGGGSGGAGGGGGNSGGPAPACEDNVDNDGDGLKDMNDPGCSSASDTDETNSSSGGGGGGGTTGTTTSATSTETTSASSTLPIVASCDMYLTSFIKPGAKNDSEQVKRLQSLLVESEGASLEVSGEYDAKTIAAVHAFQTKYASDILTPWGTTKSTGFVYLTTKKKVNEIYCKLTKEFPLTSEEAATIAKTKSQIQVNTPTRTVTSAPKPMEKATDTVNENEVGSAAKESQTAAAGEGATRSLNRLWDPVTNFFRRVFGR